MPKIVHDVHDQLAEVGRDVGIQLLDVFDELLRAGLVGPFDRLIIGKSERGYRIYVESGYRGRAPVLSGFEERSDERKTCWSSGFPTKCQSFKCDEDGICRRTGECREPKT